MLLLAVRIIPARAGSRLCEPSKLVPARDHPRARGEQELRRHASGTGAGSSPRARGAVYTIVALKAEGGIIPARAGSRPMSPWERYVCGDHPRARGEQKQTDSHEMPPLGSSPRARGAGARFRTVAPTCGIIPARAGSRWHGRLSAAIGQDHPRARGEQTRLCCGG